MEKSLHPTTVYCYTGKYHRFVAICSVVSMQLYRFFGKFLDMEVPEKWVFSTECFLLKATRGTK